MEILDLTKLSAIFLLASILLGSSFVSDKKKVIKVKQRNNRGGKKEIRPLKLHA